MRASLKYRTNMMIAIGVLTLFFGALLAPYVHAADATFSWTPNEDPVAGYNIHYGAQSRAYTQVMDCQLPSVIDGSMICTVSDLVEGETYYFAATAYTEHEESDYSTEVVYTVPEVGSIIPQPPLVFGFSKVVLYTADGTKRITIDVDGTVTIENM